MKRYQVVRAPFSKLMDEAVQKQLAKGWQLQGGVAIDKDDYCYQAMTREDLDPPQDIQKEEP